MKTPTPEPIEEAPSLGEIWTSLFESKPEENAIYNDWRHVAFTASMSPDDEERRPFSSWEVDSMGEKGKKAKKVEYVKLCLPVFKVIKG